MLSVCIPVYNFEVSKLVASLRSQIRELGLVSEILLIDDCSFLHKKENEKIAEDEVVRWIWLSQNIGRSKIRNLLATEARYTHLLFLDCDVWVEKSDFLAKYNSEIKAAPDAVLCGGRNYPAACPSAEQYLSWHYGTKRESKPTAIRSLQPYHSFMTNNFSIPKSVFSLLQFDESIIGYGHEDTLFGLNLKKKNVSVLHIHNPVMNADIETNELFLKKTENAILNLKKIAENTTARQQELTAIQLLKTVRFIERIKLDAAFRFSAAFVLPLLAKKLKSAGSSIFLFDVYKLFFYFSLR